MKHQCTSDTDLDELIGHEEGDAYREGPLVAAMRSGEELVLEGSALLSRLTLLKLQALARGLYIAETGENILVDGRFRMVLH